MLFTTNTLGACLRLCEVSQQSIRGISRYLWISTKRVCTFCMNWRQDLMQTICYFLDVSEKLLSLTCFSNDLDTLYKWLNVRRLVRFWKTWKHVNQGKTQHWAVLITLISEASFTKTVIKPKCVDRFSSKFFRAASDKCTIKFPNFMSILKTFKVV